MPNQPHEVHTTPVNLVTVAGLTDGQSYTLQNTGDSVLYLAELAECRTPQPSPPAGTACNRTYSWKLNLSPGWANGL